MTLFNTRLCPNCPCNNPCVKFIEFANDAAVFEIASVGTISFVVECSPVLVSFLFQLLCFFFLLFKWLCKNHLDVDFNAQLCSNDGLTSCWSRANALVTLVSSLCDVFCFFGSHEVASFCLHVSSFVQLQNLFHCFCVQVCHAFVMFCHLWKGLQMCLPLFCNSLCDSWKWTNDGVKFCINHCETFLRFLARHKSVHFSEMITNLKTI